MAKKNKIPAVKGEADKKSRNQFKAQKGKREEMKVKGMDPDKKLEAGKTPESRKRAQ
jgi:hypothetical protein